MIGEMTRSMVDLDDGALWQGAVKYNLACHYSLLRAAAEAIRELQESLVLDPGLIDWSLLLRLSWYVIPSERSSLP